MIKTSEFIEQYKQGKLKASTLVKMAAFKNELEKTSGLSIKELRALAKFRQSSIPGSFAFGRTAIGAEHALKNFGNTQVGRLMLGSLVMGGSFMALQEAVKALEGKYLDWSGEKEQPKLFAKVIELHPELKENEERAKLYFEALYHFSPTMATNPLTAGSYIKQALQYDHVAQGPLPASVQELTLIEKNRAQAENNSKSDSLMTTILSPFNTAAINFPSTSTK